MLYQSFTPAKQLGYCFIKSELISKPIQPFLSERSLLAG